MKELGISLKEIQGLAEQFDVNQQDFEVITPKLLQLLDEQITRVVEKLAGLSGLHREMVAYRQRIDDILPDKAPLVV